LNITGSRDFLLQCTQNENEIIRKRTKALYLTALKKSVPPDIEMQVISDK
jgi:hypothetical protein